MTKKERQALIALHRSATETKEGISADSPKDTQAFIRGYAWGIEKAMETLGFTGTERYELRSQIIDELFEARYRRESAAERQA